MYPAAIGNHIVVAGDLYAANGIENDLVVMPKYLQASTLARDCDFVIVSSDLEFFPAPSKVTFLFETTTSCLPPTSASTDCAGTNATNAPMVAHAEERNSNFLN
jgi:hypothetical protein